MDGAEHKVLEGKLRTLALAKLAGALQPPTPAQVETQQGKPQKDKGQMIGGTSQISRRVSPQSTSILLTLLDGSSFRAALRMGMASLYSPCWASTCERK